jgi:protocatechuate 3,4-dioxygenase beta subunit
LALLVFAGIRATAADDPKDRSHDRFPVSGQVVDPDGRPAAGAKVYVGPLTDEAAMRRPRATAGADGRFALSLARSEVPGPDWADARRMVRLIAEADGFGPAWTDPGEATDGRPVVLRLARDDVPIEGTIADLEGRPIAGAKIHPTVLAAGIPTGLDAFLDDYRSNPLHSIYSGRGLRWLAIRPPSWPYEIRTDEQGRFRLTSVGRERVVSMEVEGPAIEKLTIHVLTRRDVDLNRANRTSPTYRMLQAGGSWIPVFYGSRFHHLANPSRPVEGRITDRDTGRPIAGVSLLAFVANHETSVTARTDAGGRFRLLGLPTEGKLRVNALPGKGQAYLRQSVERRLRSSEEAPVRLDIPLARGVLVRGRILDGATKRGVQGWAFYLPYSDNPNLAKYPQLGADAPNYDVEPDGSFEVVALPGPGVVAARAWEERYRASRPEQWGHPTDPGGYYSTANRGLVRAEDFHAVVKVDPAPAANELRLDLVLEPGLSIRGKLVDPDGRPVAGASVYNLTAAGMGGIVAGPPSSDGAMFNATGLDPDRPRLVWFLNAQRTLGRAIRLPGPDAAPGGEPITVTLQPCATLVGRLLDSEGRPKSNVQIHSVVKVLPFGGLVDQTTHTDADGRFRFTGLLPGITYSLGGDDVPAARLGDITVRIGEAKDLGDIKDSRGG